MSLKDKTILLVEDEIIIAVAQKKSLENYGYSVLTAGSSEKAMAVIRDNNAIDLILMDIDLGKGLNGADTAKMIQAERDIPVVFLSSHTEPDIVAKTEEITSYGYVVKNSGITVLDASIKMAFKLFDANRMVSESNKTLSHHSQLLENIIENFPGFVVWKDPNSVFLGCNSNFARKMDIPSPADIIGRTDYDLPFYKEEIESFLADDRAVMQTGEAKLHFEEKEHVANGEEIYLDTCKIPLFDTDDNVSGILAVAMDITANKRAEEILRHNLKKFGERNKELNCLYTISGLVRRSDISMTDMLREVSYTLSLAYQYPENAAIRISMDETTAGTDNFRETPWMQSESISVHGRQAGTIEVCYLEEMPEESDGPFLAEERKLLAAVAELISKSTERKEAEIKLRETSGFLENLLNYANAPIIVWDPRFNIVRFNHAFESITGRTAADVIGKPLHILFPPGQIESSMELIQKTLTGERWETVEILIQHRDGPVYTLLWNSATLFSEDGSIPIATIAQGQDITERKKAEAALKNTLLFQRDLLESIPSPFFYKDVNCLYLGGNKAFEDFVGISQDKFVGKTVFEISPPEFAVEYDKSDRELLANPGSMSFETQVVYADGTFHDVIFYKSTFSNSEGKVMGIIGLINDITDRKHAEDKIKALLAEKELLLKETHHRFKNFMNSIRGILSLQANSEQEPSAAAALLDAGNRVQSMSLLYDKLFTSRDMKAIPVTIYLLPLVDDIISNFPDSSSVKVVKNIDDFILESKKLQTLGIIINELLTNIMKYAFKGRNNGLITVTVKFSSNHVTLVISDNGIGMPESVTFENSTGFGMQLVKLLMEQLEGSITIERQAGTKCIMEFNV